MKEKEEEVELLAKFDIGGFFSQIKKEYVLETKDAEVLHQNQKKFNEQMPKEWLERMQLESLIENADGLLSGDLISSEDGTGTSFEGNTNQEIIWNFFLEKGFSTKSIAGIMGNLAQESSYNPKTIQGGGRGPGTGLAQWGDDADGGRWNQLEAWASKNGKDKWAIETQLDWLWIEMNDSYHTGLFGYYLKEYGHSPGNDPLAVFKKLNNISDAMHVFELTIERAGSKHYERRMKFANEAYEKYKNYDGRRSGASSGGAGGLINPAGGIVTSPYGMRTVTELGETTASMHKGIDVAGGGLDLYAAADGKVVIASVGYNGGYGNYIKIDHGRINGNKTETLYSHCASLKVKAGDMVKQGQVIGIMGTTGYSSGIHLHYEVHINGQYVDPKGYTKYG